MDIGDFVKAISFKSVQPMNDLKVRFNIRSPEQLQGARLLLERIDEYQTVLPEEDGELRELLKPILGMPRMSTFANAAVIHRLVRELEGDAAYVNVGVWNGYTLFAGMLGHGDRRIVGVDDFSQFGGPRDSFLAEFEKYKSPRHQFFDMDYRDYFATKHQGSIGLYYYDGEHSYENQLQGLTVAEPFFSEGSHVLVDDTNWEAPRQATLDFIERSQNRYEILVDERTAWNAHPTFWNGLMVLRRTG